VRYEMTIRTKVKGGMSNLTRAWASRGDILSYNILPL
jgi:hypothetical protein